MNVLIDDHYRELFKHLSLNDLMNWRLVSKRFRVLVDSVRIKKLAIFMFKGIPPRPGKFQLLDEQYGLSDCVHVLSLDSFFKSPTIRRCLEKLEKLVISTWQPNDKNFFKVHLNELRYLEIFCCTIVHPTVLASPKLEKIFYHQVLMNDRYDSYDDSSELPIFVNDLGFDKVVSKRLKHINFRNLVDKPFFEYCIQRGLFNEIEVIECQLLDLETLLYIAENCPKLKKIDAYLGIGSTLFPPDNTTSVKKMFCDRFTDQQLRTAAIKLKRMNQSLDVFLWSLPFNLSTCERVRRFYSELGGPVAVNKAWLVIVFTDQVHKLLREFDRDNFLDEFWRKVHFVVVKNRVDEVRVCEKLTNCLSLHTFLDTDRDPAIVKSAIRSMPLQLRELYIQSEFNAQCGNDILDLLPKHVKYVSRLSLECWSPISFDFLFDMVGPKSLLLRLVHPMPPSVYLDLIRMQKHLAYFEVYCERSRDQSKEKLSAFKAEVIECLDKELGYKDAVFKINTFCHKMLHLVRYVMKRNENSFKEESLCPIDAVKSVYQKVFISVALSKGIPVDLIRI